MRALLKSLLLAGVLAGISCSGEGPAPQAVARDVQDAGEAQEAKQQETIARSGKDNFVQYCAACHGETGKGDGPVATSLEGGAPDLTQIAARNGGEFPWQDVRSVIDGRMAVDAHGTKVMPVWGYEFWVDPEGGNFEERGVLKILDGLVDYIQTIQE